MASVNDWRFELERMRAKEREEEGRFGWQDLVGLLESAAGAYVGIKGVQETGKRTELLQGAQDFNREKFDYGVTQDALRETARVGEAGRRMESEGYTRVPTLTGGYGDAAKLASMAPEPSVAPEFVGPRERPEPIDLGTYQPDLGSTWRAPPPEPTGDELFQTKLGQVGQLNDLISGFAGEGQAHLAGAGGGQNVFTPNYRQGAGAIDTGPSGPDISRFRMWAERDADMYSLAQNQAGKPGYMDQYGENVNQGHPEWLQVYESALQNYMGGAPPPEDDAGELSTGGTLIEFAQAYAEQNPEALADFAEADPMTQAVVALLSQNLPNLAGGQVAPDAPLTRGSDLSGLLETIAGEASRAGELMTGKMSEITDLDAEEMKWQGVLAQVAAEPYSGARAQREEQIRTVLNEIAAERQRRLVEARTMGVQNRRPTPLGGMGGLGSLR